MMWKSPQKDFDEMGSPRLISIKRQGIVPAQKTAMYTSQPDIVASTMKSSSFPETSEHCHWKYTPGNDT